MAPARLPEVNSETRAEDAHDMRARQEAEDTDGRGLGMFALAMSILALFFLPVILGAAGIIVGFMARRRGAEGLGAWAIGVGAAAIIVSLFIAPFF
ncbi:DUF4190 domain-containing protein [Bacillus tianshenii]|nr:DUF4190 domain-containing protein [Bacillus tianshenii]